MELLENPIRAYAWGSHTSIAAIQGRPVPSEGPEAELWIGAHPDSPSRFARPDRTDAPSSGASVAATLDEVVAADPIGVLGTRTVDRFGPRLPFMVKVLAARENLSLQAHPDAQQAAAGYDNAVDGYVDRYPKPELLVAIADFDALCGFRHPHASAADIEQLSVPALSPLVDGLRARETGEALRYAMETLLNWPSGSRTAVVADVARAAARRPEMAYISDVADRYPGDMGVLVTLLLNHVALAPDDAIWMPAGNLHAYLHGTGVEVLAASDNVLRGGLTPKPVNVDELLRVLRYEVLEEPLVKPVMLGNGVTAWPVPAPEFQLLRIVVTDGERVDVEIDGPRIVFTASGRVTVDDLGIPPGQAAFGPAAGGLSVRGDGVAFVATVGI